jgi:acetyltransferase-like isoleucine patch superfamily enzyme
VRIDYPVRLEQPGSITVGDGSVIYPRAWINPVSEWAGTKYDGQVRIGKRVMVGYNVQISAAELVQIDDDVTVAAGVVIVDHIHDHRHVQMSVFEAPLSKPDPVRIGKGSFLGVYCLIGPGVQIGEHAVVAANAVVMRNVPSYCMAAGNPARLVRFHDPNAATKPAAIEDLSGVESA